MSSKHDGHTVKYVMTNVTVEHNAQITESGDVLVTGGIEVVRIDGDTFVYCDTCGERVLSGTDGLSDEWEVT